LSNGLIPKEEAHWVPDETSVYGKALQIAFPHDIPLFLLNNWGFDLSAESDRQMLYNAVMDTKPALVILDPLLMMCGAADLDKAYQVKPMLQWLMQLGFRFNCAIAVVHHFRKQRQDSNGGAYEPRPGQRVLGSTAFHGWLASGMYCERIEDSPDGAARIRVEREFREQPPQPPWEVEMTMDEELVTTIREWSAVGQLEQIILDNPEITAGQLADVLGVDKRTLLKRAYEAPGVTVIKGGGRGHATTFSVNGN